MHLVLYIYIYIQFIYISIYIYIYIIHTYIHYLNILLQFGFSAFMVFYIFRFNFYFLNRYSLDKKFHHFLSTIFLFYFVDFLLF